MRVDEARRVLGLDPEAPIDTKVLRASYRRLVRVSHPDVNPRSDAVERTTRLIVAYRVLSEAVRRGDPATSGLFRSTPNTPTAPTAPAAAGTTGPTGERGSESARRRTRTAPPPPRSDPVTAVRLLDGDSLSVAAPAEETLMLLVEAAHELGEISYLDRAAGLVEVIVEFVEAPTSSVLFSLQGRGDGSTEVFCTVEPLSGGDAPAADAVTRLVLRTLREVQA